MFDSTTKLFLLNILNEATGTGISGPAWLSDPSILTPPPKGKEKDWYTTLIKGSSEQLGGNFDPSYYDGGPSLGTLAALGMLKRGMGYGTKGNKGTELLGGLNFSSGASFAKSLIPTAAKIGLASAALTTMGPIGVGLDKKLPYLAALGVDPFDYATQVMGVDYVADQLSKLGPRQKQQNTSGAGYIKL